MLRQKNLNQMNKLNSVRNCTEFLNKIILGVYMKNIEKICEYFKSGETENQLLGLELEHFICNDKMSVAPYDLICDFLNCVKSHTKGELYVV